MIDDEKANTIASQAIIDLLIARFPNTFRPSSQMKLPLKVGILADLTARCPDVDDALLRLALRDYCGDLSYQLALSAHGVVRIDLDGAASGIVTAEQSAHARGIYIAAYEKKNPAEAVASAG